jgi:hypothetical protein
VSFRFETGGCLVDEYEAMGKFDIHKNHLIIHPFIANPLDCVTKTIRKSIDSLCIEVLTVDNNPVSPSLIIYNDKKKAIFGGIIGSNGKMYLTKKYVDFTDSIRIADIGYSPVAIKIDKDYDYKIVLQKRYGKAQYEAFLNSNGGGLKFRIRKNRILIYRPELSCSDSYHFWQSFVLE